MLCDALATTTEDTLHDETSYIHTAIPLRLGVACSVGHNFVSCFSLPVTWDCLCSWTYYLVTLFTVYDSVRATAIWLAKYGARLERECIFVFFLKLSFRLV